ncbi:MAG: gliding motility lipoprotein GldH [Chitinophagales bacterium]|nr:gliding motility lipoprotein GldH [Chitinophagales bacterium]
MNFRWIISSVFVLLLWSCNENVIYDKNLPIEKELWSYDAPKIFTVDINDTLSTYNIFIQLRHSFHFEWRNLWVKVETVYPDGKKLTERVNLLLCEPDGKWFGSCLNDQCFIKIPLQENAYFPKKGTYTFSISQDMRQNPLPKVRFIGLRIEKSAAKPSRVKR